jgi:hypothetical protein
MFDFRHEQPEGDALPPIEIKVPQLALNQLIRGFRSQYKKVV